MSDGRPVASAVPRGIEVLLKKAAVDAGFRAALLERPAEAPAAIGLELGPTEATILRAVRPEQLRAAIAHTRVDPRAVPVFMGRDAGAMLEAADRYSPRYVAPVAVLGTLAGPLDQPAGWALLAAMLGAIALPMVLLWRWVRRRRRRRPPGDGR
jgi:hypothetical protein